MLSLINNPQPNLYLGDTSIQQTLAMPHEYKFHCKWIAHELHE